jgi:hypothetical protein
MATVAVSPAKSGDCRRRGGWETGQGGSRHGGEAIWGRGEDGKLTGRLVHGGAHGWEEAGCAGPHKSLRSPTHRS